MLMNWWFHKMFWTFLKTVRKAIIGIASGLKYFRGSRIYKLKYFLTKRYNLFADSMHLIMNLKEKVCKMFFLIKKITRIHVTLGANRLEPWSLIAI
jgi:hypothetical protein